MEKIKNIIDGDTAKVIGMALVPAGLTLTQISSIVTIIAGICSIAYTLKRWCDKNHRRNLKDEDTDL